MVTGTTKPLAVTLRLAVVKLASCSGCQLALLSGVEGLAARLSWLTPVLCSLLTSASIPDDACYDLVLVEGAVATESEARLLRSLRSRSTWLVAIGACAQGGGVLSGRGLQPAAAIVEVDSSVYGCPPDAEELVTLCGAVARGGVPATKSGPLCLECRRHETDCLLRAGGSCLGPVTRAGCGAACPTRRIPCEGCRGRAAEANEIEMRRLLLEAGLSGCQIERRLRLFSQEGL